MWLLDANMDVHLVNLLAEFGIKCEAATRHGWGSLSNGDLIAAAIKAGFTCILTQDRLFAESATGAISADSRLSIVVVQLPQKPWREYTRQFRDAWVTHPINPVPGAVLQWPEVQSA